MFKTLGKFWKSWTAGSLSLLALVLLSAVVWAVGLSGYLINEPALAIDANYTVNLKAAGVNTVSAQAVFSSATLSSDSFQDGQVSTGNVTIANAAAVSSAAASNSVTIVSTNGIQGQALAFPGFVLREGINWKKKDTSSGTAASLAAALAVIPNMSISRVSNVIYTTAPAGSYYNSAWQFSSSSPTVLSVAHQYFTGGLNNAVLTINGVPLRQGKDWQVGATSATAATSIVAAIAASARLNPYIAATANSPTNGRIALQAKATGSSYNFAISASTNAITTLHPTMIGGADSAYVLNQPTITISGHNLTLGLAVLYSSGGATVSIGGLTNQTTYYAIPVTANSFSLASSKANAILGTAIPLTSSATPTAAHTFTIAPLAFTTGVTTGLKWQVSNDGSTYSDMAVSSVSWVSGGGAGSTSWDLGRINYQYLRAKVVGPTTGGLNLQVTVLGSNTF